MVRGYWGDIVQSPLLAFGVEVWSQPEKDNFSKQINYQRVYTSEDVCEYHIMHYMTKLETGADYKYKFERIDQVTKQEDDLATVEEVGDDEEEKKEDLVEKLSKPGKPIELVSEMTEEEKTSDVRHLLPGL